MNVASNRRPLAIVSAVLLPALLVGVAAMGEGTPATVPSFAAASSPAMPFVPHDGFINSTWFCAGVPMGEGEGGSVTIANPADAPLTGVLTAFTDAEATLEVELPFDVPSRDSLTIDLADVQPAGTYVSAMVEIAGGGGFVEQQADHPDGSAVSPCSNSTSATWYFADNYTLNGSQEDLVITNPFPDQAIVDISFASNDGQRSPPALQGVPIPGNSVLVRDQTYLAKDEAVLGVSIVASRGRVVVGRAQQYLGERQGYSMTLGSPAPSTTWTFADGQNDGNFERYSIYNPGEEQAVIAPVFLGVNSENYVPPDLIVIEPGRVASLNIADVEGLPAGRHAAQFIAQSSVPVVIERAITRETDDGYITSVVRGVDANFASTETGYFRWSMAIGTDLAVADVLVIVNLSGLDGAVAVKALGPGGEADIPGLEAVPMPANGVITIAIPDVDAALGVPLIVVGTQPIVVERLLPRGDGMRGRSGSLALPG
ncbi:MAG: DUF5719 family protein [Ilumatobacteraceae bacterium]